MKFKGRHSISNLLEYKIEAHYKDSTNHYITISGKWKSGTRFHNYSFNMTNDEWAQLQSLERDKKLNKILK